MSKAIDPFGGQNPEHAQPPTEHVIESEAPDWRKRQERAVWYGVAGIGLMFAGSINTALGVGGALMAIFGIVEYIRWALKKPRSENPWKDPELDAWEEEHYGDGNGLNDPNEMEAENVVEPNPDAAWGMTRERF